MFPEHVERSFLDPEGIFDEYFQLGSRRKVGPIKNQLASPNTSNKVREEIFAQLSKGFRQERNVTWYLDWSDRSRSVAFLVEVFGKHGA